MARGIIGVIVGYVTMAVFIFATFTAAYLLMGTDAAFEPGSYAVSSLWILASIVLGLIAAVLGGYVCAVIARQPKVPVILAVFVLVLGVILAIPTLGGSSENPPAPRPADVDAMEAMRIAEQPAWVSLLNPVIGAVGVLIGARLRRERPAAA
jgi:amino acid transporter